MVNFFKTLMLASLLGLSACANSDRFIRSDMPDQAMQTTDPADLATLPTLSPEPTMPVSEPAVEGAQPIAATSLPFTAQTINGAWHLTIGQEVCQIFTSHTKLHQGYRASTRQCPLPFNMVHGWAVKDNMLILFNSANESLVSLTLQPPPTDLDPNLDPNLDQDPTEEEPVPNAPPSFVGTTGDGIIVMLNR